MIGYLRGLIVARTANAVTILAGGVGYEVIVDHQTEQGLPQVGEEVALYIRTVVSQDDIRLFGFLDIVGREVFDILRALPNIGPKSASQILGGLPIAELVAAIRDKDVKRLMQIPGVGRKTAERLCLELAEKFALIPISTPMTEGIPKRLLDDVRSALTNLGFTQRDIEAAIRVLGPVNGKVLLEDLIKQAITYLSTR